MTYNNNNDDSIDAALPDLPAPVEWVLTETMEITRPRKVHRTNNHYYYHPREKQHRVRFATHTHVHEIPRVTIQEKEELWYSDKECRIMMMHFLGGTDYSLPSSSSSSSRTTTTHVLQTAALTWVVGSLWLGSLVMGILVTKTMGNQPTKR